MNYRLNLFLILITLTACSSNKKPVAATDDGKDTVSIHKVWQYDNVKSAAGNPGVIGKHLLDLTNKDTLHFSYQSIKGSATAYAYHIKHDTVFVNKNAAYKILKLTGAELDLYTIFKNGNANRDSVIMVYKRK